MIERRAVTKGSVRVLLMWRDALDAYLLFLLASGVSPGTVRLRMHHARRFARLAKSPSQITTEQLLGVLARDGLAPESRKAIRSSARKLFGWMFEEGLLEADPAARLPKIRVPAGVPRPAPEEVIARGLLLADERSKAMLMLAAYAGLRCCEIAKVHAGDIDGQLLHVVGKGGKQRSVPLHPMVAASLPATAGYLFPGQDNGHLSPLYVCKLIGRALPDGWTAHKLRHRFATAAYAVERDLFAVQQLLGHSTPVITARYTQLPADALHRAVLGAGPVVAA